MCHDRGKAPRATRYAALSISRSIGWLVDLVSRRVHAVALWEAVAAEAHGPHEFDSVDHVVDEFDVRVPF